VKTKYIVVDVPAGLSTHRIAITFAETLGHDDMARALRAQREDVHSAGFFNVVESEGHALRVQTYGESVSLNLKPDERDAVLIAKAIGIHESCY
jgi:hypothetical protein